jgi:hypothetical protein
VETTTSTTTATAATSKRRVRSLYVTKYTKNIQQANERTAEEYEYRLARFEKYIAEASEQEQQQPQNQDPRITIIPLDRVIDELKTSSKKIYPYDLLSGFVAYLQKEEGIENPNTIRYFVTTARNFLEYHDIEISPRKFKLRVRLPKVIVRRKESLNESPVYPTFLSAR